MRSLTVSLTLVMMASVHSTGGSALAAPSLRCPLPWERGWVPNKRVAEAIFRAVATTLPNPRFKEYPIVTAEDAGDHWLVAQASNKPAIKASSDGVTETITIEHGGSQLYMNIDKCSGAISHAFLNR